MNKKNKRVLVAMSGGVDSSVSAALLQEQGYDVVGMTMQVWDYSLPETNIQKDNGTCCSSLDVEDARLVCQKLKIPFYVLNCEARFKKQVIDKFVDSYQKGYTPIPCVDCNTFLKFDLLIQKMEQLECAYLATGHYAKIIKTDNNKHHIYKSTDNWKDQTYFLFTIAPNLVSRLLFPVGDIDKSTVRKIAEQKGLGISRKKDSTGICFVGAGGYAKFIEKQLGNKFVVKTGDIKLYPSGKVIGTHKGLHNFTYGQRKGLGVCSNNPMYVIKVDVKNNTLWLGEESHLYSKTVKIRELNWLDTVKEGERLQVKIRFHHQGCWVRVYKQDSNILLELETPQKAVTPGQAAVLYRGDQLVGGGSIYAFS